MSSAHTVNFTSAIPLDTERWSNLLDMYICLVNIFHQNSKPPFWHRKYSFTLHRFDDFPEIFCPRLASLISTCYSSTVFSVLRNNSPKQNVTDGVCYG